MLAMLFASYIMQGKVKYSEVPEMLKPQVKQILEGEGLGHLAKD